MKRKFLNWLLEVIGYSILVALILGAIAVFGPLLSQIYSQVLNTIGGWIYLTFVVLGILTRSFVHEYRVRRANESNK